MGTQVGYREGREMLTRAGDTEPCERALGFRGEEILVRGHVLVMEKIPEPCHGEMPKAWLCAQNIEHISNKYPNTNGKNIP